MARTFRVASQAAAVLCRSARCVSSAAGTTTTTISLSTTTTRPPSSNHQQQQQQQHRHFAGGWDQRGYDMTAESLDWGERPKVVIEAHAPTGFDVRNTVRKIDTTTDDPAATAKRTTTMTTTEEDESDGTVHMNGSILVFPYGCFLWKIESAADVTVESLVAPVVLHRPKLDYLFVGCNKYGGKGGVPREEMARIQEELLKHGIVAEQLNLSNAIGTFNIL